MTGATLPSKDSVPKELAFDWHTYGLIVEFKDTEKEDPFRTMEDAKKAGTIEKSDDASILTLGQLAHYAAELFSHQHRTHAFQLFIVANFFRVLYWDRAGCIVSDRVDYEKQPQLLADFIWWYNHLSPTQRGWDSTVSEPLPEEVHLFRTEAEKFLKTMKDKNSSQRYIDGADKTVDPKWPPYKLTIRAEKTGRSQDVIVQKPFDVSGSPTGRTTRAYLAYSLTEGKIVFFKDSWRVDIKELSDEDSIYYDLIAAGIKNIPQVLCAGDVLVHEESPSENGVATVKKVPQVTLTQKVAQEEQAEWRIKCSASRDHMHHRVVQELAYSLSTVTGSKQYVQAFLDAINSEFILLSELGSS